MNKITRTMGFRQRRVPVCGLRAAIAGACLALAAAAPALAADAVFPPGARLGLTPPGAMQPSRTFRGFEDAEQNAAILMLELPLIAYADMDKAMTPEALAKQGFALEKREEMPIAGGGKAILFTGRQDNVPGLKLRKWLLLASVSDLTGLLTVQVPDGAPAQYSEAAIRASLGTLTARPNPVAEQMSMLPFKIEELSGFRVARVIGQGGALLTDGPRDDADQTDQPYLIVAVGRGGPDRAADRGEFARQAMLSISGFKEMRLTSAEPMRLGGQPGYEVRADARNANGQPVTMAMWMRFGAGGYMQWLGVAPKDGWPQAFPRFRAVRDGVVPR
ncbi:MAG: hypothetical protein AB7K04_02480 [Pseudorhodoplanes sp.]